MNFWYKNLQKSGIQVNKIAHLLSTLASQQRDTLETFGFNFNANSHTHSRSRDHVGCGEVGLAITKALINEKILMK